MQKDSGTALSVTCDVVGSLLGLFIIQLVDKNRVIVSQCQCRANSTAHFSVDTQGEYMITVAPCQAMSCINPLGACRWVMLSPTHHSTQFFRFCKMVQRPPELVTVHFSLTDAYYPNLPIKEGELTLWQNMS